VIAIRRSPDGADLAHLCRSLTALAEPTRQQIVLALAGTELGVAGLAARFPLTRPAVSHHLKILTLAGLLRCERRGRERVYRVDVDQLEACAGRLAEFVSWCRNAAEAPAPAPGSDAPGRRPISD
jgi:DNA-binding transcriptional ArsR family regulator